VSAYSLNFTATQTQGSGDLRVWPAGSSPPLVSTLNYVGGTTVANAAIVPASFDGTITVTAAVSGTHLLIDINGYFTAMPNDGNPWDFVVDAPGEAAFTGENTWPSASTAALTIGVQGTASCLGDHSAAVLGQHTASASGEVGGVLGLAGQPAMPLYGPAGVRGESAGFFGVLGISRNHIAVAGSNVTGGLEQTWGTLGHDDSVAVAGGGSSSISGSKSFVEPHPMDASKVIQFVSLEGNEAGTYFRGRGKLERGIARIPVPDHFRMVTAEDGLRLQVTPIGELATVAVVRLGLDEIVIKGSRNVEFFYTVNGLRRGYENFQPVVEGEFFVPRTAGYRIPGGLSSEAKRKLIANGTYNADGTVNLETARRLGWAEKWKSGSVPPGEGK
jgi:hypothetical protein